MQKRFYVYILILLAFSFQDAGAALTEVVGASAESNALILDVDKNYPQVEFTIFKKDNKILVNLLGSKYGDRFRFNIPTKKSIIDGLDFVDDVSIGQSGVDTEESKVGIWLTLNDENSYAPKVLSMEEGKIHISFPKGEASQVIANNAELDTTRKPDTSEDPTLVSMTVVDLYNQATDAYSMSDVETAERLYKEVLEQDGDFFLAKFNLANIYLDRKDFEGSSKLLNELKEKFEGFIKSDEKNLLIVKNTLGIAYYTNGEYEKALKEFRDIVAVNENVHEPYFNIGLIYEKLKDYKEAKRYFKKAIENKNDFVDAYYHLGVLSLITKDKRDAAKYFKGVIEIDPYGTVGMLSKKELEKIDKKYKK